jgi:hypothetical protein
MRKSNENNESFLNIPERAKIILAQYISLPRIRLIRYFDLYSSKSRGKWKDWVLATSGELPFKIEHLK